MRLNKFRIFESDDRFKSFTREVYDFEIKSLSGYIKRHNDKSTLINFLIQLDDFLQEYKDEGLLKVNLTNYYQNAIVIKYNIHTKLSSTDEVLEASQILTKISYIFDLGAEYGFPTISFYNNDIGSHIQIRYLFYLK